MILVNAVSKFAWAMSICALDMVHIHSDANFNEWYIMLQPIIT